MAGTLLCLLLLAVHYETSSGGSIHMLMPPNRGFAITFDSPLFQIDSTTRHQRHDLPRGTHYVKVSGGGYPFGPSTSAEYSVEIRD